MSSKLTKPSKQIVGVDLSKMNSRDILESAAMLFSCCAVMRSSFGIFTMLNDVQQPSLTLEELKEFAAKFDSVHTYFFRLYQALQTKGLEMKEKEKAELSSGSNRS